ncbi:MAG: hypothetical protein ACRC33_06245 [Gemmataceae bacterium]
MPAAEPGDVILEILRQADGEWVGKTKLFKAFYFAHVYSAIKRPVPLTDWAIARMPRGPGIHDSDRLFGSLVAAGTLLIERVHVGPYPEFRYRLTDKGKAVPGLTGEALAAVHDAATFCSSRTASELSQITHEYSRSWNEGADGELLNVAIDAIPDDEYDARKAGIRRIDAQLSHLFGDEYA